MLVIALYLLLLLGCFAIAWSMPKHQRQWFSAAFSELRQKILRGTGWGLILIPVFVSCAYYSIGLALTVYFATLTLAIFTMAMANTWVSRR